jgi:hypothetical protein
MHHISPFTHQLRFFEAHSSVRFSCTVLVFVYIYMCLYDGVSPHCYVFPSDEAKDFLFNLPNLSSRIRSWGSQSL